jgi:hypothetical protein
MHFDYDVIDVSESPNHFRLVSHGQVRSTKMETKHRFAGVAIATIYVFTLAGCDAASMRSAENPASQSAQTSNATCQPNFSLALSPASATITSGQNARLTIELTSICGLAGIVDVGIQNISPSPIGNNGFTFTQSRYDIPLVANGSAGAYITFGATAATLKTTYTITIQGKDISGCCHGLQHSATFLLTVK